MITLSELAFACFVYGGVSNYDESYLRFLKITDGTPNLGNPNHRKALLAWLNKWGCRQFALKYHDHASGQVLAWHNEYGSTLCPRDRNLRELSDAELAAAGAAYDSLSRRIASYRTGEEGPYAISFGPTGTSKILFAIRPHALPPWDDAIRKGLRYDKSQASYVSFVRDVQSLLEDLARRCHRRGFRLADLPRVLQRPHSTIPKLVDEYYWVTITKGCSPPDSTTLQRWFKWSQL